MRKYLSFVFLFVAVLAYAQGPNGTGNYYRDADGKKGKALKTALHGIINSHTTLSYNDLWECYKTTDVRADGKIWDMYSNITNYRPGTDQGGNYSAEGDCYNREHSMPKSWFGEASPMVSDLMHIVPTDGYVNNRRSNYPFGETNGESYKSANGFSKLGKSTTPGYSGTVFEPNDEYKGDFARIYFYMVTCYENSVASWNSDMLASNTYPAFKTWALDMLLRWAKEDPVSEKEINRNNAVYGLQHNRNPFVDYPGLEQYVWGSNVDKAFSFDNYDSTVDPGSNPGTGPGTGSGTDPVTPPSGGEQVFRLVTSTADLQVGKTYLLVYAEGSLALSNNAGKYYNGESVTISGNQITAEVDGSAMPHQLVLGGDASGYTFYDVAGEGYLAINNNDNVLHKNAEVSDNAKWTVSVSGDNAIIKSNVYGDRTIQYNAGAPRFATYKSSQEPVCLFVNVTPPSGVKTVGTMKNRKKILVYDLHGRKVGTAANLPSLPRGIYMVGGKKVMK